MVRSCRDTFVADCTLTLWKLEWDEASNKFVRAPGVPLIDDAASRQGGAEVGGGPWWDTWTATSKVSKPILALLRLPIRIQAAQQKIFERNKQ